MCGRYYVDEDLAAELRQIFRDIDRLLKGQKLAGDVRPSEEALALFCTQDVWQPALMRWGFPGRDGKQLVINARSETVTEKPTFRQSVRERRCVIPASGFYEWSGKTAGSLRQKYSFFLPERKNMYLAGCFREDEDGHRFVILTAAANASMAPVHDRMPLLIPADRLDDWGRQQGNYPELLVREQEQLGRRAEYEQMSLKLF